MTMVPRIVAQCVRCDISVCLLPGVATMVVKVPANEPVNYLRCENCGELGLKISGDIEVAYL